MNFPSNKESLHFQLPKEKAVARVNDVIIGHVDWEDIGFKPDVLSKTGNVEVSPPHGSFFPLSLHLHPDHEDLVPEQALDVDPLALELANLCRV